MSALPTALVLLAAFLAVFTQSALDLTRGLLGAQLDLLPPLVVYAALATNLPTVTLLALAGGLWFDALSANPLGTTPAPLVVVGLLLHLRRGLLLGSQTYARLVLGAGASALVPLLSLGVLLSAGQEPILGWGSLWQWLVLTASGAALTPAVFAVLDGARCALSYRPVSEPSFRPDREIRRGRR